MKEEINNEEILINFLNTLNNLENEYLDYSDEVPEKVKNLKDKLMGIKKSRKYSSLDIKKTNQSMSDLGKNFIFKVIEDLEVDIDIKKRKGINFSSEVKDLRDIKRELKSSKKNIGELMLFYREKFNEDLFERFESKVEVSFYQNRMFWVGILLGFILGNLKNILIFLKSFFN
jgi:predicted  nucleic acid-binding Zn-ribbon protein